MRRRSSSACSSSGCRPDASARVYGPGGEQAALRLFRRLPAGAELAESARAVTAALATLGGRSLESLRIEAVGPGMYRLALVAGGAELAVRLDRSGVRSPRSACDMAEKRHYVACIDLDGRSVLVVGGGPRRAREGRGACSTAARM